MPARIYNAKNVKLTIDGRPIDDLSFVDYKAAGPVLAGDVLNFTVTGTVVSSFSYPVQEIRRAQDFRRFNAFMAWVYRGVGRRAQELQRVLRPEASRGLRRPRKPYPSSEWQTKG